MTNCTTYLRHRFLGPAVALVMLVAICVQVTGTVPVQGPNGTLSAQGPNGGGRGNIPGCHCCHGKVFLKLDKRYDLKPLVFLSTPSFRLVVPQVRRVRGCFPVLRGSSLAVLRPAGLRGPPTS
jgi:hypothetical protein